MTMTIDAVYEAGIFRPLEPTSLTEGEQVKLTVNAPDLAELERSAPDPRRAAEIMAEIAAMPMETDETEVQKRMEIVHKINALTVSHDREENASRDHDKYLYGPDGVR